MSTRRCSTVLTDPEIPAQIASWTFSSTSSGSGLADVLDCSIWLKYRSSTGGPPFPRLSRRLEGNHPLCPTGGFPQDSGRYLRDPAPAPGRQWLRYLCLTGPTRRSILIFTSPQSGQGGSEHAAGAVRG